MIEKTVEKLIYYSKKHLFLDELDAIYVRNVLFGKLHIAYPYTKNDIDFNEIDNLAVPDILISELKNDILENNLVDSSEIDRFITNIMGDLTPLPSMVKDKFYSFKNPQDGFDYLYDLQIKNNYIQKTAVDKNLLWKADFGDNYLEISINLSKPEKKNSDIAKLVASSGVPSNKYPNCLLCKENLGFVGTSSHPARGNIRIIPLNLDGARWYLQYSPYVYYYQHCIVFDETHQKMTMGLTKFRRLFSFVEQFPCFFIGSNSELPIVGGSILNHEHFQGGKHLLPLMFAKDKFVIDTPKYPKCKLSYLNFYNSTFKIESEDKEEAINLLNEIYTSWRVYDDKEVDIISHEGNTQHSTVTPIVRKEGNKYIAFAILRNNRTTEKYPDGIFHAHKEYHNIKSEGIGLIEAAGLYILPARLKRQSESIAKILSNKTIDVENFITNNPDFEIHRNFIIRLITQFGRDLSFEKASEIVRLSINETCVNILKNTATFKDDEIGQKHLQKFIAQLNLKQI